ncbi:hypothetical protein BDV96DRAFT_151106 [Lophiotrema nucula]|uniref:Uncharacterized protein n=1 Tax=Lophiotrema nucula TaxID=690887 RepID=A0A6A5Z0Z3_9PLEO|nr:hypothetical protein BDV96DRAFT_151106 [Lophiotrema nucula]
MAELLLISTTTARRQECKYLAKGIRRFNFSLKTSLSYRRAAVEENCRSRYQWLCHTVLSGILQGTYLDQTPQGSFHPLNPYQLSHYFHEITRKMRLSTIFFSSLISIITSACLTTNGVVGCTNAVSTSVCVSDCICRCRGQKLECLKEARTCSLGGYRNCMSE